MSNTLSTQPPFVLGEPTAYAGLALLPLTNVRDPELEYVGLDEALSLGFTVSEIDAGGSVNRLLVRNPLSVPVLLFEGEELVGAKQNRVLDRTVLVPAKTSTPIGVNCVERGRWGDQGTQFSAAPRAAHPAGRHAARLGGQGAVWSEIAQKSARLDAVSTTEAAAEMYLSRATSLSEYLGALPRVAGQCGSIVSIGGRIVCLDYVSRSEVYAGLHAKLVRGYALDALEHQGEAPFPHDYARLFIERIGRAERRNGELLGRNLVGTEVVVAGETVSLSVLPSRLSR